MTNIKIVEKLDEATVRRVLDGSATLAEFNSLEPLIVDRLNYVVRKIVDLSLLNLDWWDFDNLGEGKEDDGFFDRNAYSHSVGIVRVCHGTSYKNICFDKYAESIPVEFIWSDFEDQVSKELEDFKNHIDVNAIHAANKAVEARQAFDCMVASIKAKLTPEELAYIEFRSPKRSDKRRK